MNRFSLLNGRGVIRNTQKSDPVRICSQVFEYHDRDTCDHFRICNTTSDYGVIVTSSELEKKLVHQGYYKLDMLGLLRYTILIATA